jgi:hypothetical protein
MRKTLIVGVLSIGIVTLVTVNAHAWPGDYAAHEGEVALDLNKPENMARLTGKWEGTWQNINPGERLPGQILQVYSFDPKGDEEKPVVRPTKRRPAGLLGGPDKWSKGRASTDERGRVVSTGGLRFNSTYILYERPDGTLVLRGEAHGVGTSLHSTIAYELHKLEDGRLSQHFPNPRYPGE